MSIITSRIKTFVRSRKLNVFFIFLLLAFFILVLARLSASYTNTVKFNVNLKDIPDEMIVLNDSSNTLNLTMTTSGFQWLKYYFNTPSVAIDFRKDIRKSDSVYIWSLSRGYAGINNQFRKEIKLKTINPDTLIFNVDINAVKMVPVKPNLKLDYTPGYDVLDSIVAFPDSVKVIGPESLIKKLKFLETELFEKNDINKPINTRLILKLDSLDNQILVKTKAVSIAINAEKFTEGTITLPLNLINIPNNLEVNYFPKTVTVSYYTNLTSFKAVNIEDFKVICDFKERNSQSAYLTPKLVASPKNIKSARLHEQKIEYIISE
ncbi:CdaR family protein [Lacinutrix chionoecetis]